MEDHQDTAENDELEYDIIDAAENDEGEYDIIDAAEALSDAGGPTSPIAPLTPNNVPATSSPAPGLESQVQEVIALRGQLEFRDTEITRWKQTTQLSQMFYECLSSQDDEIWAEENVQLHLRMAGRLAARIRSRDAQIAEMETQLESRDDYITSLETQVGEFEAREAAQNFSHANVQQGGSSAASQLTERERIQHEHSIDHLTRHLTGARRAVACLVEKLKEEEQTAGNLRVQLGDLRRRIGDLGEDQRMPDARDHAEMRDPHMRW
ncbi:hypothetical protein DSL72_007241 [Monilinia vaccinii-corymbosi]|uniref:Uncharacterized protein n=1 Tax=Monilinia vaccinii-corymbosi TaxID=61207 RepID=A0A8A3PMP5_9HELO|nr:hypothetical protein DSL72_007241 [Monilinia vaccinii-corymbosi]